MRWLGQLSHRMTAMAQAVHLPAPVLAALSLLRANLGLKLLVLTVGAVLVGLAGSSFLTLSLQHAQLIESAQASAQRVNSVLRTSLEYAMLTNNPDMIEEMLTATAGTSGLERIRVLDTRGEARASSVPGEVGQVFAFGDPICVACHTGGAAAPPGMPASLMTDSSLLNISIIDNSKECSACHDAGQKVLGLLLVETPMTELHEQTRASLIRLIGAAFGTFALLVLLLVPALNVSIIRPVKRLTQAAAEIGSGNLDQAAGLDRPDELGRLGEAFDSMRQQLKAARRVMEERNQELRMLNEVARAASELLDPQQILELGIKVVAHGPGILGGAIFLRDADCGRYRLQACHGLSHTTCANVSCALHTFVLSRRAIGQSVVVTDVEAAPCPPGADLDGQKCSWISIPLTARGNEVGRMALVTRPGHRVTEKGIAILRTMGEEIGVALANAVEYQRAQYLGAIAERDRLAREMHDSLAQALGYLKLKANLTDQLLNEGEIDQAQAYLKEVKEIAGETYTDVREAIFGLRHAGALDRDFLGDLEAYLADYRTHYNLDVRLCPTNGFRPAFSPPVSLQVTRIIQEALANVRKHAGVEEASVRIDRLNDNWRITVEDRGRGFDPGSARSAGPKFLGLQIMHERAESVGARLTLEAQPDQGTRVILDVPVQN